jgi:hypothetical protein
MSVNPPPPTQDGPVMLKGSDLALGLVALVTEIVVFAGLLHLAYELSSPGSARMVVAGIVGAAAICGWGLFMAPKGPRRLPVRWRVFVAAALALVVGGLLIAVDETRWGYVVLAAGAALSLVQWQIGERTTQRRPAPRPDDE